MVCASLELGDINDPQRQSWWCPHTEDHTVLTCIYDASELTKRKHLSEMAAAHALALHHSLDSPGHHPRCQRGSLKAAELHLPAQFTASTSVYTSSHPAAPKETCKLKGFLRWEAPIWPSCTLKFH